MWAMDSKRFQIVAFMQLWRGGMSRTCPSSAPDLNLRLPPVGLCDSGRAGSWWLVIKLTDRLEQMYHRARKRASYIESCRGALPVDPVMSILPRVEETQA